MTFPALVLVVALGTAPCPYRLALALERRCSLHVSHPQILELLWLPIAPASLFSARRLHSPASHPLLVCLRPLCVARLQLSPAFFDRLGVYSILPDLHGFVVFVSYPLCTYCPEVSLVAG
jgi:hypothetical protein